MINGNGREKGIKILHWNKGPSYLQNKVTQLETIIESHRPHILGLSEANLKSEQEKCSLFDSNIKSLEKELDD